MSRKWMKYMMLVMLAACAISVSNAQQKQSANRPVTAVFDVGAAKASQSKLAKDQQRLAIMQRCKLDVCRAEAAKLRIEIMRLQAAVPPHLLRTQGCSPTYSCGGQPGYYIYGNIQDSCATQVTVEACPSGHPCYSQSGTTSAAVEGATSGYGVCNFTWTDSTGTHADYNVPMQ